MEKDVLLQKTQQLASPFETGNIIHFASNLSVKSIMENPWIILIILVIFAYAAIKRSRVMLSSLFAVVCVVILARFTLTGAEEESLALSSTLPFAFGALVIGGALIYFIFIKSE